MTEAATAPAGAPLADRRWGLGDAAWGWAVVQVVGAVWAGVVLAATDHTRTDPDALPLDVVALAQLGLAGAMLAVPWAVTQWKGRGLVADLGVRARWADLWALAAGGLLQVPGLALLYWPLLELLDKSMDDVGKRAVSLTDRADDAVGVLLLLLIVGVLAPVFEEIFYRGLLQRALLKRGIRPVVAVAVSSVVFGLSHLELLPLPGLVAAGALFGYLAYRYDRLGPAIAAHVGFNLVAVGTLLAT